MSRQLATLLGVFALLCWATLVGLLRLSTDNFGAMHTVTYVYTLSAIILYFTYGLPDFSKASKKFICISMHVLCHFRIMLCIVHHPRQFF